MFIQQTIIEYCYGLDSTSISSLLLNLYFSTLNLKNLYLKVSYFCIFQSHQAINSILILFTILQVESAVPQDCPYF